MPNFQTKPRPEPPKPEVWDFAKGEYTKILAFSGKLGSGKTSCANYLHALAFMHHLGLTREAFVNESGKLVVLNDHDEYYEGNLDSKDPEVIQFLSERVWPFIKKYSCADPLKKIAIDVLGLDENLVYSSQEDKKTLTSLKWEDMPTFQVDKLKNNKKNSIAQQIDGPEVKTGFMTVRDVLEYIGTEIFRKMDNDCWAKALIRTIKKEKSSFAVVDDVRFPNEVQEIQKAGGKVIRLTLITPESQTNSHDSNIALDNYAGFDTIVDNSSMTMEDTFREIIRILIDWEWFKVVNQ